MESTVQNLNIIKDNLTLDIILMREKYADRLSDEMLAKLDDEIDQKIMKLLPGYNGKIPVGEAFMPPLYRTVENFVAVNSI